MRDICASSRAINMIGPVSCANWFMTSGITASRQPNICLEAAILLIKFIFLFLNFKISQSRGSIIKYKKGKKNLTIIDESYNNIENDNDRFFKILSVIDDLMSKSMEELHEMYVESLPTIIYNQNVVRDMNPNVLLDKLFDRISRV